MWRLGWLVIACVVGAWSSAAAQEVTPKFAQQSDIAVIEPERMLQTLVLPFDVYTHMQRVDLGDLRVLDGDGRPVPHAIRTLSEPQLTVAAAVEVPIFPLLPRTDEQAQAQGLPWVIEAETSESGAIVRVKQATVKVSADAEVDAIARAYLIDVSGLERAPEALVIELARANEADLLMDVQVEASTDLSTWMTIGSGTLAHLQHDDRRIDRARIDLVQPNPYPYRYLRIAPPQPSPDFVIEHVRAVVPPEQRPLDTLHSTVLARVAKDRDTYVFDVPVSIAVEAVALLLPNERTFASAQLYGVMAGHDQREPLWNGVIYRLGPTSQLNDPIALQGRHFKRLELVVDAKGGGIGDGMPQLDVRFAPQQLLFVARGKGPFTLVYGSVQAEPAAFEASELIGNRNIKDLPHETAKLSQPTPRDGNAALKPIDKPRASITTKTIVLWSLLIAAVLATAVLAYRVFRERQ